MYDNEEPIDLARPDLAPIIEEIRLEVYKYLETRVDPESKKIMDVWCTIDYDWQHMNLRALEIRITMKYNVGNIVAGDFKQKVVKNFILFELGDDILEHEIQSAIVEHIQADDSMINTLRDVYNINAISVKVDCNNNILNLVTKYV